MYLLILSVHKLGKTSKPKYRAESDLDVGGFPTKCNTT